MLPRECGEFSTRGAGRGRFEGEKREHSPRVHTLHLLPVAVLRGAVAVNSTASEPVIPVARTLHVSLQSSSLAA